LKKNKEKKNQTQNYQDGINLDYDYNTEYGDGDIPNIDKPGNENKQHFI